MLFLQYSEHIKSYCYLGFGKKRSLHYCIFIQRIEKHRYDWQGGDEYMENNDSNESLIFPMVDLLRLPSLSWTADQEKLARRRIM